MAAYTTPAGTYKLWEIEEYLTKFTINENGCWIWPKLRDKHGYGYVLYYSAHYLAHRVMYELIYGPIPKSITIDHLCRVRCCVNPYHLEAVTLAENIRRATERRHAANSRG